jgi:hypothetical protein
MRFSTSDTKTRAAETSQAGDEVAEVWAVLKPTLLVANQIHRGGDNEGHGSSGKPTPGDVAIHQACLERSCLLSLAEQPAQG